jgi:hypothetical protein
VLRSRCGVQRLGSLSARLQLNGMHSAVSTVDETSQTLVLDEQKDSRYDSLLSRWMVHHQKA